MSDDVRGQILGSPESLQITHVQHDALAQPEAAVADGSRKGQRTLVCECQARPDITGRALGGQQESGAYAMASAPTNK